MKYFGALYALQRHLRGFHGLNRKEYEDIYGCAEATINYWTCRICNKNLKCQKFIIVQHLNYLHSMELGDYERRYMIAKDEYEAEEGKQNETMFSAFTLENGIEVVPLDQPEKHKDFLVNEPITSISGLPVEGGVHMPWYYGCRYSCRICNKIWHYPQLARIHFYSVHKLTKADYEVSKKTNEKLLFILLHL